MGSSHSLIASVRISQRAHVGCSSSEEMEKAEEDFVPLTGFGTTENGGDGKGIIEQHILDPEWKWPEKSEDLR